jgi:sialate O-acetylesterase
MLTRRLILLAGLAALAAPAARADVKPHPLFSDNMVLQRGTTCPIWGTADPGENVTVTIDVVSGKDAKSSIKLRTTARDDGWWMVRVGTFQANDKLTVTIAGKNTVTLKNVLAGDVWVCSGQSNMEWRVKQLTKGDQGKKVADKAKNPKLRLFTVPNVTAATPQKTFPVNAKAQEGLWLEWTPETVINFSAVGYFFGRDLAKALDVPIGLISSDWGGTPAEAWTSKEGLLADPNVSYYVGKADEAVKALDPEKARAQYEVQLKKWQAAAAKAKKDGKKAPARPRAPGKGLNPHTPSSLYNGMIAPLVPFAVTGAIWYQGESNAGRAAEYRTLMPDLIRDWRAKWGTELPFLMVQLAPFKGGASGVDYAELRDAQLHTAQVLPKVGLAVITDVGEENDIHPQEKAPVGARLALAARAIAYGQNVEFSGPVFQGLRLEGNKAVVSFGHVGGGLVAKGGDLTGFAVAGSDGKFYPAKAEIKGDTVVVSSDKVATPTAVRYGWTNFAKPELNFFN